MPGRRARSAKQAAGAAAAKRSRLTIGAALLATSLAGLGGIVLLSPSSAIGGPFTLTKGDGRPVTDLDFRGRYLLVYFGYTSCPDVCPTTLSDVAAAVEKLGPAADRVQPLFITVDPRRDSAEVVGKYAASFQHVIGLTGTAEQVDQVARAYRISRAPHQTGPGPDDYTMDHSSVLYLMGPDGRFVAPIAADASAETIRAALSRYMI